MDRFGLEFEFSSPPDRVKHDLERVSELLRSSGINSETSQWQYNTDNRVWICKPDSSCGMEICSPVFQRGEFSALESALKLIGSDASVITDEQCSVHLHVDVVQEFHDNHKLCSLLGWWIKFEHIFVDFAAPWRKRNRFCKCIGETFLFDHGEDVSLHRAFSKMSDKYLTMNTFHMFNKRRNSVEFRLLEATKDFSLVKNWVDLIFHFVDRCMESEPPKDYSWSDPELFFEFMNFGEGSRIGPWLLDRLVENCSRDHMLPRYLDLRNSRHFG